MAVVAPNSYDSENSNDTVDYDFDSDAEPMAMFLTVDSGKLAVTGNTPVCDKQQKHEASGTGTEDGSGVVSNSEGEVKTVKKTDSVLRLQLQSKNNFEIRNLLNKETKLPGLPSSQKINGNESITVGEDRNKSVSSREENLNTGDNTKSKSDFLRIQFVNSEKNRNPEGPDHGVQDKDNVINLADTFVLKTTFKQEKPFIMGDENAQEIDEGCNINQEKEFISDVDAMQSKMSVYSTGNNSDDLSKDTDPILSRPMYSNEALTPTITSFLSKEISQDLGDLTQYPEKANLTASMYKNDVLVDELRKQHALPESSHAMIAQFLENEVQTAMKRAVLKRFMPMPIGDSSFIQSEPSSFGEVASTSVSQDSLSLQQDDSNEPKMPEMIDCAFVVNGKTLRPCSVCGKVFKTTKELRIHFRTHTNEKPFACEICGKAFRQRAHLASHEKIHSGEKPFTCELCHTSFTENSSLKRHLRRHFGIKPFRCELCGENFITSTLLKSHNRRRHEDKKYEYRCDICPKIYSCKESLNKHKRSHDPETRISCEKCGLVCLTQGHLRRHLMVHERQETMTKEIKMKPFECGSCGKTYTMKSHLERHLLNSCGKVPNKCKECDIVFETRYAYRQHRADKHHQTYAKLRPHKCPMCDMHFRFERSCDAHVAKVHTKIKPFECDVCFKKFGRRSKLVNHRQGHFSRDFKCGVCDKTYPSARGLKDHMSKKHLNQDKVAKEAFCEICHKVFCDKTVLKEHTRTQHAEVVEKFVCAICGSSFSRKHSLTRHMQVHDENKPRLVVGSCDICDKAFYTKYGLTEHKRIIHAIIREEDKFTCPGCGKKYIRKHSMKRHIRRTSCKNSVGYLNSLKEMEGETEGKESEENDSSEDDEPGSSQDVAEKSGFVDGNAQQHISARSEVGERNENIGMSESEKEDALFNISSADLLADSDDDEDTRNSDDDDDDDSYNSDDKSDMEVDSDDNSSDEDEVSDNADDDEDANDISEMNNSCEEDFVSRSPKLSL